MTLPLHPPVAVQRPALVKRLPSTAHLRFDVKLDGWRSIALVNDNEVVLQARKGRIITTRFGEVLSGLATLPAGTVLDGELVAVRDGQFDFHALAGTAGTRRRRGAAVSYVAFDMLALAGEVTMGLPLAERWERLVELLREHPPGVELVMTTTDREEALGWLEAIAPIGVEGLIAKDVRRPYKPGKGNGWWKYRVTDTVDGTLTGVVGSGIKPRALRVRLAGGREVVTGELSDLQRQHLFEAVRAFGQDAIRVELRITAPGGRHEQVAFVRVRPPD